MKTAILAAVLLVPSVALAQGPTIFVGPRGTYISQPTNYGGWTVTPRGFGVWFNPYPAYPAYPTYWQQNQYFAPVYHQPVYQQRWGF